VKYKFLKSASTVVTQRQTMRAVTKKRVVMADKLALSQEDETQIHHLTHPVAQFTVVWITFFHGDLGLKRRLLKV